MLPGPYLRLVALEYKDAVADFLWIKAIHFISDQGDKDYGWFYIALDRITDLDPKFSYAYNTGAITLSVLSDNVEWSNALLKKGLKNEPEKWDIPYLLGFNYLYHLKDPLQAACYMKIASTKKNSPPHLASLAASLYQKGGHRDLALLVLIQMYQNTHDETLKEGIRQRIEKLRREGADAGH